MSFKKEVWNVACPVCGLQYKSDAMKQRWDGQWVCQRDWESRHPQDLVRTRKEVSNQLPVAYPDTPGPSVGPTYTIPLDPVPPGTFNTSG